MCLGRKDIKKQEGSMKENKMETVRARAVEIKKKSGGLGRRIRFMVMLCLWRLSAGWKQCLFNSSRVNGTFMSLSCNHVTPGVSFPFCFSLSLSLPVCPSLFFSLSRIAGQIRGEPLLCFCKHCPLSVLGLWGQDQLGGGIRWWVTHWSGLVYIR